MLNDRKFWIVLMASVIALYVVAALAAAAGQFAHITVRLALIVLAAHLLEIPVAFSQLKGRGAQPARVVVATLLFGAAWWLPARRGLFAVA